MKRTIFSLVGVLIASMILVDWLVWPSENYALGMIVVDVIAAAIILWRPAGKAQAIIGLTFLLQIGVHAGRLANGEQADFLLYWWGLSLLAFLQLFVMGGWWIHERLSRGGDVHAGSPLPSPAYRKGVE